MCGIVGIVGRRIDPDQLGGALARLDHRGPDARATWTDEAVPIALGFARLAIVDLSDAGVQPMQSADGRYVLVFNGEVYNYLELRDELAAYPFRSRADSEVVLAAWATWGPACVDRFIGMFAFAIWDRVERTLTAVRDRFGVKPLVYAMTSGELVFASEAKALHALGVSREPDVVTWAGYLAAGTHDHGERTFWRGVSSLPAGCMLTWKTDAPVRVTRWYDLAARIGLDYDARPATVVAEEYRALLAESVRLRFRSDVPVGINLSGGVDSSTLLGLVDQLQGRDSNLKVFSFATGDPAYDELPWVADMLARTSHPLVACTLDASAVPERAARMARAVDEPYGGIPTLAYSLLFEAARRAGVIVLLDGQGMDEQWAGYDYYASTAANVPTVQGSSDPAVRPDCLSPELVAQVEPPAKLDPFPDRLRNLQLRDTLQTKIPRALRYNDRISMAASTELREPFLDHRLFELAVAQPQERKIQGSARKVLLREITAPLIPEGIRHAPKRPVQTPQREWLRGPLRDWASAAIEASLRAQPSWFDEKAVKLAWHAFCGGRGDNSNWVWQWLSVALPHT